MSISRRTNINILSSIIESDNQIEIILSNENYKMIFENQLSNQYIDTINNIKKYINKNKNIDDNRDETNIIISIRTILMHISLLYHNFFTTPNNYNNEKFNKFKNIMEKLPEDKRVDIYSIQYNIILLYVETLYNKLITKENIFEKNYNKYNEIHIYLISYEELITRNHNILRISDSDYNFLKFYLNYIIDIIDIIKSQYEHINTIYNRLNNKSFQNRLSSYISNSNLNSITSLRRGGINEYINYKYKNKIYKRKIHYDGNKKYIIINKNRIYIKRIN